jgi:hypothetical protein
MTLSWAQFMQMNHTPGRIIRDNFQNRIYPEIGLYLLGITLLFSLIYYYWLNGRFGRYYTLRSWLVVLVVCFLTVWIVTYFRANVLLDRPVIDVSKHLLWIGIINAIYSAILFFLFALVFKWGSPMGKRTPF